MLVLFDQGTPVPIRPFLVGHTVKTAAEQGWSTLSNGNLMNAAEGAGFEILVTTGAALVLPLHLFAPVRGTRCAPVRS